MPFVHTMISYVLAFAKKRFNEIQYGRRCVPIFVPHLYWIPYSKTILPVYIILFVGFCSILFFWNCLIIHNPLCYWFLWTLCHRSNLFAQCMFTCVNVSLDCVSNLFQLIFFSVSFFLCCDVTLLFQIRTKVCSY